jgi:spore maturation protein CgeB
MNIVFIGLSITSSWGNGHATTYRALLKALAANHHKLTFLEQDQPWYADNRDMRAMPGVDIQLYASLDELRKKVALIHTADAVIIGSYVPRAIEVARWVFEHAEGIVAFYDIDTPVTLAKLEAADHEYIDPATIAKYDLYLSFTGGPTLKTLEKKYKAKKALPLYCSVEPENYFPEKMVPKWDLGYLGTYSADRQPGLTALLMEPARNLPERRFIVAGPQYPDDIQWPTNVARVQHLNPSEHRRFYNQQRFTLNITRKAMRAAGYSPSIRLFEAGACGVPIISDSWAGLETIFTPGEDILIADRADQVIDYLREVSNERARQIGQRGRERIMAQHTAAHRARELERYLEAAQSSAPKTVAGPNFELNPKETLVL